MLKGKRAHIWRSRREGSPSKEDSERRGVGNSGWEWGQEAGSDGEEDRGQR